MVMSLQHYGKKYHGIAHIIYNRLDQQSKCLDTVIISLEEVLDIGIK